MRVILFWAKIGAYSSVGDVFPSVCWDIVFGDELHCVGALDNVGNAKG